MINKMPLPLIMVEWTDSVRIGPQWTRMDEIENDDDVKGPMHCVTVGFAVKESADAITLAHSLGDPAGSDAQFDGVMTIPRCAVVRVETLRSEVFDRFFPSDWQQP